MPSYNENQQKFADLYRANLLKAREKYQNGYFWPVEELDTVHSKMMVALIRGTANKDSHAIKWTCKELGIKPTYTEIKKFLGPENAE